MQFINSVFMQSSVHNYLASKDMNWQYQMISSASVKNEPGALVELCLRNYSTAGAEQSNSQEMFADFVQRMVVPALQDDPTGSIAILCRKGKELEGIQQALDESDISSLYQPDRSLAEHTYLSPLLSWLRFVAWGDYTDFVAFLRSDYLRINTPLLKETLKRIRDGKYSADGTSVATNTVAADILSAKQPDFSGLPLVHTLHILAKSQAGKSPTEICRTMMDNCLGSKILNQRDYLNLHRWLDILVAWEIGQAEKGSSIPDLLQFIAENYATEDLKQVSISSTDSMQLLTIHKSKGLQFKCVFVFYNLSSGHREDSSVLKWAVQYADKDFHLVSDFGISYHYEKVLKA
jgi:ATP-dependent exoDNAse (exonuclease V) beta subunit